MILYFHCTSNKTGDCEWSTPCTSGVCFVNNTGCPVMGAYLLKYNQSDYDEPTKPGNDYLEDGGHHYHHHIATVFVCILAGIIFAIFLGCVATRHR